MTMPRGGSAEVAHVGQVIEDGDGGRMIIRATAEQTAGALYEFDWFIHPGQRLAPHYHPNQEEHFEGVSGTPHVMINGKRHILRPGDHRRCPRVLTTQSATPPLRWATRSPPSGLR
jgi:quercetin dioxygenase-like cupin family protein